MAKTKQFTIAVENRPGAVAEIARTLGEAKANILALSYRHLLPLWQRIIRPLWA